MRKKGEAHAHGDRGDQLRRPLFAKDGYEYIHAQTITNNHCCVAEPRRDALFPRGPFPIPTPTLSLPR